MATPMDGPFNSLQELEAAKKVYEDYFHIQLNKCHYTTIEAYRKRAPNRHMNDNLKYQALTLVCIKYGEYQSTSAGVRTMYSGRC